MFMCRKSLLSGSQWLSLANNQDRNDKHNQDHLGLIIRFTSVIMIICQRNKMIMQIILQADFLNSHHYHQNNIGIGNLNHMHRRNEERGQGVPLAPPIRSKMGPIRSKIGGKGPKWGHFRCFYPSRKSKFRSKGAELFWAPPILCLNCAYDHMTKKQ